MYNEKETILDKVRRRLFKKPGVGTADEWVKYEIETRKKHPILYFIFEIVPDTIRLWWFRNVVSYINEMKSKHIRKVHHVVMDIDRFPVGTIKKRNYNYWNFSAPIKMLHMNFQILVDVYENTEEGKRDYKIHLLNGREGAAWREFEDLYIWWTVDRPRRDEKYPKLEDFGLSDNFWGVDDDGVKNEKKPQFKSWQKAEEKSLNLIKEHELEDKEMLLRLIAYSDLLH